MDKLVSFISDKIAIGLYEDQRHVPTIALMRDQMPRLAALLLTFAKDNGISLQFDDGKEPFNLINLTESNLPEKIEAARCWRMRVMQKGDMLKQWNFDDRYDWIKPNRYIFEFWRSENNFIITDHPNMYARKIAEDFARSKNLFSANHSPFLFKDLHPKPLDSTINFPIDIVYTWVNHKDEKWQKLYEHETKEAWKKSSLKDRYVSRDELLYSLRSVSMFAPWVNRIYIVSNCDPPAWLKTTHPKIQWVYHEEIFTAECLPTFNSHAIESRLHHIPSLSEHFLYLNDDFIFARPQYPQQYFQSNGVSLSCMEDYGVVNGDEQHRSYEYLNAARNGKVLIETKFGVSPTQLHRHTPYALKKTVLHEIERTYPFEIAATSSSKFRNVTDISLPSFLYHHYSYLTRHSIRNSPLISRLIKFTNPNYKARLQRLLRAQDVDVVCINDGAGSAESLEWNQTVDAFYATYFPEKSQYEV